MLGSNELIFALHVLLAGTALLAAARMGKTWLAGLITACAILMNIAAAKNMTLFGLDVTGGNVLFATIFLASDVVNEHYGRRVARNMVWIGFAAGTFCAIMMLIVLWYRPNPFDTVQPHLIFLFDVSGYPRIIAASMTSYLLAQMIDVACYHAIRVRTGADRLLWLRSNASTWISQTFDTAFFTTAGLTGWNGPIHSWTVWRDAVIFALIIKLGIAAAQTPFLYLTNHPRLRPPGSRRGTSTIDAPGGDLVDSN